MLPAIQAFEALLVPASAGLVLLALWAGHRVVALAAGGLAIVQLATLVPWVAGDRAVAPAHDALVVMAGNLQYGRGDPATVVSAVRRRDVDVLALSEVTPDARDALGAAGITADLPHVVDQAREGPGGGMILSRHPVATDAVPPVPTMTFATPAAVVDAPGGKALVVAAHPVPPWPGDTERWHSELAALASWRQTSDPTSASSSPGTSTRRRPTPCCGASLTPGCATPTVSSGAARSPHGRAAGGSACRWSRCCTSITSCRVASASPLREAWRSPAATTTPSGRRLRPAAR